MITKKFVPGRREGSETGWIITAKNYNELESFREYLEKNCFYVTMCGVVEDEENGKVTDWVVPADKTSLIKESEEELRDIIKSFKKGVS